MPYAELAMFIVKVLGVPGPYTLALDRTNWKVGALSTGQKMRRNLLYDIKRSEQMTSLSDQNDVVELWS
jgi:hypothetical protein